MVISFSGQVGRTIEAAHQAAAFGHRVIALTHDADSPLGEAADEVLLVDVPTLGFSPGTSSYVGMLVTLLNLAASAANGPFADSGFSNSCRRSCPSSLPRLWLCARCPVLAAAEQLLGARVVTFLGAGPNEASRAIRCGKARGRASTAVEGHQPRGVGTRGVLHDTTR